MKIIKFLIPVVFLILSAFVMQSGEYLKNAGQGHKIPTLLDDIKVNVQDEKWDEAEKNALLIQKIYKDTSKLIQFSVEREDLIGFKSHLALLEGYLVSKDYESSVAEIYVLHEFWYELGK